MSVRKRRMRKQPSRAYSPWDWGAEPGDRVYEYQRESFVIYDIRASRGRNKRDAGELTAHLVKKNGVARRALRDDSGVWYWGDDYDGGE